MGSGAGRREAAALDDCSADGGDEDAHGYHHHLFCDLPSNVCARRRGGDLAELKDDLKDEQLAQDHACPSSPLSPPPRLGRRLCNSTRANQYRHVPSGIASRCPHATHPASELSEPRLDRELRMAIKERVVVREAAVRRRSDCGGRGSGRRGFASGTLIVRRSGRLARTSAITWGKTSGTNKALWENEYYAESETETVFFDHVPP